MEGRLRRAKAEDIPSINRMDCSRPDDLDPGEQTLEAIVVEASDCLVAYGALKIRAEVVVATNRTVSAGVRAQALKHMMQYAAQYARKEGLGELYAFSSDMEFVNFIKRHFGFEEVPEKSLVLDLRRSSGT